MKIIGTCFNLVLFALLLFSCSTRPQFGFPGTEEVRVSGNSDRSSSSSNFRVTIPTRSLILTDEQFQNITTLDATRANRDQLDFSRKYRERFSASSEMNNAMLTGKWEEARADFQTAIVLMLNFWPSMGPDSFVLTNIISGDITPAKWRIEGIISTHRRETKTGD